MKIAQIRKQKGLTQSILAEKCATSQQQIAKIEGGVVDPRLSTLRRIANALQCEVSELFYSRSEFISQIEMLIKEFNLSTNDLSLLYLNNLAAQESLLPTFHPFWEEIELVKGKVRFKRGSK